jgi:RNA polymerase sigma-70 factor (ECF subfamily)
VRSQPDDVLLAAWHEAEPKLRRLIAAMGLARTEIDDVLQDVYLAAHQSEPLPKEEEDCRRWLFRVAINRCRLEYRRMRRWQTIWENLRRRWAEYLGDSQVDKAAGSEEQCALWRALQQLSDELRNPIVLRYYCDLNSTDIGQILGMPAATVRGRLCEARRQLATALDKAGFHPDE